MIPRDASETPPPLPWKARQPMSGLIGASFGFIVVLGVLLFLPIFVWVFCRIDPGTGQIAILIRKTGHDLPSGQILALEPGQKGIQTNVLTEGRYFYNPYTWGWRIAPIT